MAQRKGPKASTSVEEKKTSKAAAAAAEAKPEPKSYEWRELVLELPEEVPGELMFDFYDFEEQQRNEETRVGPMFSLIKSLIGAEQFQVVRAKVRADKLSMEETGEQLSVLLDGLLEQYGMGLGES